MTTRRAWWLVAFLWLAFCLNFADRQVVFSIFPLLRRELRFSDTQLGLTSSVFLWVYAICSPAAGMLGDRFPKRRLVTLSVILWSVVTFVTGLSHSPLFLLACRALIGVTEALFYPCAVALIASAHGPETVSRALAFFNSGNIFGVAGGGWYGGLIAERLQWRWAFFSLGIAGVLYALPLGRFLRTVPASPHAPHSQPPWRGIGTFFRTPTYVAAAAVYAVFSFTVYLQYTWLPNFLTEKFSLGLADAGFTGTAYLNGGSLAGLLLGGWAADRGFRYTHASRAWVVVAALCLAAPCASGIAMARSLGEIIAAAVGFGCCTGLYLSNLFAAAFEVVAPEHRASAAGFLNLVGAFFSGFAGLLGGALKHSLGLEGLILAAAGACLLVGLSFAAVIRLSFEKDYQRARA